MKILSSISSLKRGFLILFLLFTVADTGIYNAAEISKTSAVVNRAATEFTLEDQFGNKTTVKFPASKSVILVFGDREGSSQVENWVRPLYNRFSNRVFIFGIAELSAVPWVARPIVRGIIKSKSDNSIMLDWSGKIAKSYGCEKGKANVFLINRNGEIKAIKRGAATSRELQSLYAAVEANL